MNNATPARFVQQQNPASAQRFPMKNNAIFNLDVWESTVRDKVVKFCGWPASTMPRKDLTHNDLRRTSTSNMPVYEAVKLAEQDIKGSVMRTVVMAALNFDFTQARELCS